jgi:hypothetical protein
MAGTRKIAAIVVTDVVGYSRIAGSARIAAQGSRDSRCR